MEKKEIELIQLEGILVDKNDMQIGAGIFGYDIISNLLYFFQVGNNNALHAVGMTKDLFEEGIIKDEKDFEYFLSKAKDHCKMYCCTYEDLWNYKQKHNFKKVNGKVTVERKASPSLNKDSGKIEIEALENLQQANSEPGLNQNKESEIIQ